MQLITLSGLDGSGKSTQIELLKNLIQEQGQKVYYFHAVTFSIANQWLGGKKAPGENQSITKASEWKVLLRKIALIIDSWRFKKLYHKLQQNYDFILSDRYFYDQIINILFLENQYQLHQNWWQKMAAENIIKPDYALYLQMDINLIFERDRQIEQDKKYLEHKKRLYDQFAQKFNLSIINGNLSKEKVFEKIQSVIST